MRNHSSHSTLLLPFFFFGSFYSELYSLVLGALASYYYFLFYIPYSLFTIYLASFYPFYYFTYFLFTIYLVSIQYLFSIILPQIHSKFFTSKNKKIKMANAVNAVTPPQCPYPIDIDEVGHIEESERLHLQTSKLFRLPVAIYKQCHVWCAKPSMHTFVG